MISKYKLLSSKKNKSLAFSLVIICEIVVLSVVTQYLLWSSSNKSVNQISNSLLYELGNKLSLLTETYLNYASLALCQTRAIAESNYWNISDFNSIRRYFWTQITTNKDVSLNYIGFPNGKFVGYARCPDGTYRYLQTDPSPGNLTRNEYDVDSFGNPTVQIAYEIYDSRARVWYSQAVQTGQVGWTPVYPFAANPELGITISAPLYSNNSSNLTAVVAVDIVLGLVTIFFRLIYSPKNAHPLLFFFFEQLNQYLQDEKAFLQGDVFVMERHGSLIATSTNDTVDFYHQIVSANASSQSKIVQVTNFLLSMSNGNFSGIQPINNTDFTLSDGTIILIAVTEITGNFSGIDWILVLMVPKDTFFSQIDSTIKTTIIICVIVIIVAILAAMLSAHCLISRPLAKIGSGMDRIKTELDFAKEAGFARDSFYLLSEIESMAESYAEMKIGLQSFAKYVPLEVVKLVLHNKANAQLNVEPLRVSIFFSDIENFTTISERIEPNVLIEMLQSYFKAMATVIHNCNGTLADYIGDAVFAFWNAPIEVKFHEIIAVESALQQQEALAVLRETWKEKNLPELKVRMGLHCGNVLCGNVGSAERFKYTIIGDNVNLASRLENLNKKFSIPFTLFVSFSKLSPFLKTRYGTYVLISEDLYEKVRNNFLCRVLDTVAVKGKTKPTKIFEVMARMKEATEKQHNVCNLSELAFQAYLSKDFDSAIEFWSKIEKKKIETYISVKKIWEGGFCV